MEEIQQKYLHASSYVCTFQVVIIWVKTSKLLDVISSEVGRFNSQLISINVSELVWTVLHR
jgi:hypothetical protein